MRARWLLPLALLAACKPTTSAQPSRVAPAAVPPPVLLRTADGVAVHGVFYRAEPSRALILLFHQAGSSKAEYATIAPRLTAAGYSALAIDQRSGGDLFGRNETAAGLGAARAQDLAQDAGYPQAYPDLEAALGWARARGEPIVIWGSSYSSALAFRLASEHPERVVGVLAFSPGEYLPDRRSVRAAAAMVRVPVLVASTASDEERGLADPIYAALPGGRNTRLTPPQAVHGSSMLVRVRNPAVAQIWPDVLEFLDRVTRR